MRLCRLQLDISSTGEIVSITTGYIIYRWDYVDYHWIYHLQVSLCRLQLDISSTGEIVSITTGYIIYRWDCVDYHWIYHLQVRLCRLQLDISSTGEIVSITTGYIIYRWDCVITTGYIIYRWDCVDYNWIYHLQVRLCRLPLDISSTGEIVSITIGYIIYRWDCVDHNWIYHLQVRLCRLPLDYHLQVRLCRLQLDISSTGEIVSITIGYIIYRWDYVDYHWMYHLVSPFDTTQHTLEITCISYKWYRTHCNGNNGPATPPQPLLTALLEDNQSWFFSYVFFNCVNTHSQDHTEPWTLCVSVCVRTLTTFTNMSKQATKTDLIYVCVCVCKNIDHLHQHKQKKKQQWQTWPMYLFVCIRTLTTFTNMSKQTTKTDLNHVCVCVRTLTTFTNISKKTLTKTNLTLMYLIDF